MFVLTRVYNCTCVCMCLDNSFGVSTMNNTMYLHYVEQRLEHLEGQDKFERSNINSISAISRVHAEVLEVARKGI